MTRYKLLALNRKSGSFMSATIVIDYQDANEKRYERCEMLTIWNACSSSQMLYHFTADVLSSLTIFRDKAPMQINPYVFRFAGSSGSVAF